ncbi:MAG: hypothetical protein P8Z76_19340 [Alphaproteobacteria bacterium]
MFTPRIHTGAIALISALAVVVQGCASAPPQPPPSAELRAQFGPMAVVSAGRSAPPSIQTPVRGAGQGAAMGAGQGALGMIVGGAGSGSPGGLIIGVALAPVAAIVGGVIGAARAHPDKEVTAAQSAMTKALRELDFENRLRDKFVEITRRDTGVAVEALSESDHRASFRHLAQERQTVLQLDARLGFKVAGRIEPDVTPMMIVRGRVIRTSDDTMLYQRLWCAKGAKSSYFDLAKNDAAALRSMVSSMGDTVAVHMVHDLFIARSTDSMSSLRACGLRVRPLSTQPKPKAMPVGSAAPKPAGAPRGGESAPYTNPYCDEHFAVAYC